MKISHKPSRSPVPVRKMGDEHKEKINPLSFSYTANRGYSNFGFGAFNRGSGDNISQHFITTNDVRQALDTAFRRGDVDHLRALSRHFFKVSGVYSRAAAYLAYLPTYDYLLTPRVFGENTVSTERVTSSIISQLKYLEQAKLKQTLGQITLDIILDGVAYVYWRRQGEISAIQKLPVKACRTITTMNGLPTVEFNLQYIDGISDPTEKVRFLNSLPTEVIAEYNKLVHDRKTGQNTSGKRQNKQGLNGDYFNDWVLLDPSFATAFYFNPSKQPILANSFFAILDVMELKGIEKKKAENELYNLVVQQFHFNDDGEPEIELPDMQAFHQSASKIFEQTNQTDLLTTLADVKNINLNEAAAAPINFDPWNKSVYGELGVSSQLFSTEGNMALEKSILIDEALVRQLIEKYQDWINAILIREFGRTSSFDTSIWFPPITVNNRMELSQKYKDMATLGYSKVLPALALGQSQLDILSIAVFENDMLDMASIMKPLQSSHTASAKDGDNKGGRPPLPDSEKSDKTIANQN